MGHQLTDIDRLTVEIRERNTLLGWRNKGNTFGDYIALLHSEVTEAVEAYRDHKIEDATEVVYGSYVPKPESVGSEFADVAIRLLDMSDVFGVTLDRALVTHVPGPTILPETFGDHCAYLHLRISDALTAYHQQAVDTVRTADLNRALSAVLTTMESSCFVFGIDLAAEVARKMRYNATRPYRHGRGTLIACTCESETWTPDTPRGEDGLDHHPNCPMDKPRAELA